MNKNKIKIIIIYITFIILMVLVILAKKNLHVDEVYSYGLSNSRSISLQLKFDDGIRYEPSNVPYINYVTVANDRKFDFKNVWQKQIYDVHPPFYYCLVHIMSSFFPEVFSVWFAGIINIVFAVLTLYIFRKLVRLFVLDDRLINISSITFIFSTGILSSVSFFRMYVIAMFFFTIYTYLFIWAEETEEFTVKFWVTLGITSIVGALTHYYCIVYLFVSCVVFGIFLLINKKRDEIIVFFEIMLLSGIVAWNIFPDMTNHMFNGKRGVEAISNLSNISSSDYWHRIKSFYSFINNQMFGGGLGCLFVVFLVLFIVGYFTEKNVNDNTNSKLDNNKENKKIFIKLVQLILPLLLFFAFVAKSAAYVTDRYVFPIYSICLVLGIYIAYIGSSYLKNDYFKYGVVCLVFGIMTINSWKNCDWPYLYKDTEVFLEKTEEYSDVDCLCIYNRPWRFQPAFYEVNNYKSVTFLQNNNIEQLANTECIYAEELVVLIINGEENIINEIIQMCSQLDKYERIGGYSYTSTYYMFK